MKIKGLLDDNDTNGGLTSITNREYEQQELSVEYIQPWSNFICKIKLPDEVFVDLQKLYF